jgi:DNA-binding TFAR19-related protein (PDSD5 family)
MNIFLHDIKIDQERLRKDMGDIEGFAESIRDNRKDLPGTKGLLHPVVIDGQMRLVAGGRRMTAFAYLHKTYPQEGWDAIPYTLIEDLPASVRRKLELEENIRRHAMSWQEEVLGIAEYHNQCVREGIRDGIKWSQNMTSELLNIEQASVSINLKVAKYITKHPDSPVAKAENMSAAVQLMTKEALDIAAKEQLRRVELRRAEAAKNVSLAKAEVSTSTIDLAKIQLPTLSKPSEPSLTLEQISAFYYHGDALKVLPEIAKTTRINHIITDPPFGIDMDNIDTGAVGKIDRVADEHDVSSNLELLEQLMRVAFDCIADDGFMCFWYDLDHHEKLQNWASKIGWRPCRWPLVWCKSSPCVNNQAVFNITKATEVCMFLRRSEKSIIKQKLQKNWFVADAIRDATHPFVKPAECWDIPMQTVSTEGQVIVDPFAGQGSSLVRFFRGKRVPIGVEIKQEHIAHGLNFIQTRLSAPSTDVSGLLSDLPL